MAAVINWSARMHRKELILLAKRFVVGQQFGELTVLEELEPHITPNGSPQRIVKVRCSCGNIYETRLTSAQKSRMCKACLDKKRRQDITGQRFGKLIVTSMADDYISPSGHRLSRCNCLCDCGNTCVVNMSALITGATTSCGCTRNSRGLLKDNQHLVAQYDFKKNKELDLEFDKLTAASNVKVWWKCKKCGNSWLATIASQNDKHKKHGCPYCSGRFVIKGKNDLLSQHPDVVAEWDYDKNAIGPDEVSSNSAKKVWWKCEKGHEYKSSIVNRTKSKGTCCPYCSGNKVLKGFNDLATNPELLKEWDYSKNTIKPDEVTKGTHKKIWWICSNNHSYEATIPARRRGTGCPYCSGNKILVGFNDLATTNPELLEKWNYEKNNKLGITPKSISKSYSKKVWWKCKNGHEYQRHVYNERKGSGRCPICKKLKL